MKTCAECGMMVDRATTYHPYAACLMFKACHDGKTVQANLDAVMAHGAKSVQLTQLAYMTKRGAVYGGNTSAPGTVPLYRVDIDVKP